MWNKGNPLFPLLSRYRPVTIFAERRIWFLIAYPLSLHAVSALAGIINSNEHIAEAVYKVEFILQPIRATRYRPQRLCRPVVA